MKRDFWLLLDGEVGNELHAPSYLLATVLLFANEGSSLSVSQNEKQAHDPVTHNTFRLFQAFLRLLNCTIPICLGKPLIMRFKMDICGISRLDRSMPSALRLRSIQARGGFFAHGSN